jgi:addiction module HigA family antidote
MFGSRTRTEPIHDGVILLTEGNVGGDMFKNGMRPVHPGEVLLEDYIKPMGISVHALSLALKVPYSRLREIVDGRRGVSADTALRLERYFGSDAQGWLNLQAAYDLRVAQKISAAAISLEIAPLAAAG